MRDSGSNPDLGLFQFMMNQMRKLLEVFMEVFSYDSIFEEVTSIEHGCFDSFNIYHKCNSRPAPSTGRGPQ
jgi:hypothetical protein